MLKLLKLFVVVLAAAALMLVVTPVANAQQPTTFLVELSAESEIPECPEASGATGFAYVSINEASGRITYRVVAFNLPGTIAGSPGAHIHEGPATGTGLIVLGLDLTGLNSGVVASGTTVDPTLANAILLNPENYYINVHTTECPTGAIRGQLG